jgi:5-formyltetrahydrofolate cyclo-ligase
LKDKTAWRKIGMSAREALNEAVSRRFSEKIALTLIKYPAVASARTILSYYPLKGEVDARFFNEYALQAGKTLAFPICQANGEMIAAIPDSPDDMEKGELGVKSPVKDRSTIIAPTDIDVAVTPCVAFSARDKTRLGRGGGYYDRYLPLCGNAVKIAIAYEVQRADDLPRDEWDAPLDVIITEAAVY